MLSGESGVLFSPNDPANRLYPIDSRASQIAALTRWLRVQRAYQAMDFKADRPIIAQTNIVCAEPMH